MRAAIAVADRGGEVALTMAAVARELGPYTTMALYRYVGSKGGLIDLMLDDVTGEIPVPDSLGSDWRAQIYALASASWAMVKRHIWFAQLVHTRPPLGPRMMRRTEFMLAVFTGQGASLGDAMTYAALLDRHIYGSALQEAEERAMRLHFGIESARQLTAAIMAARERAAAGGYPNLERWMAAPSGASLDEQFELSLQFLLDGITVRLSDQPDPRR
ncbi:MAG TPA: TetR/AcrR family transcriptional regulator C-terminal domain-containing protein [Ktedonobacterales bacterium]|nr:TetR/AcrR family transcriptional regulator C-terminal domain-containing protein [Ktedonobacterales bacterium]